MLNEAYASDGFVSLLLVDAFCDAGEKAPAGVAEDKFNAEEELKEVVTFSAPDKSFGTSLALSDELRCSSAAAGSTLGALGGGADEEPKNDFEKKLETEDSPDTRLRSSTS